MNGESDVVLARLLSELLGEGRPGARTLPAVTELVAELARGVRGAALAPAK